MSGLEVVGVFGVVAGIISAFHDIDPGSRRRKNGDETQRMKAWNSLCLLVRPKSRRSMTSTSQGWGRDLPLETVSLDLLRTVFRIIYVSLTQASNRSGPCRVE
jgi:hypothetical protein